MRGESYDEMAVSRLLCNAGEERAGSSSSGGDGDGRQCCCGISSSMPRPAFR